MGTITIVDILIDVFYIKINGGKQMVQAEKYYVVRSVKEKDELFTTIEAASLVINSDFPVTFE